MFSLIYSVLVRALVLFLPSVLSVAMSYRTVYRGYYRFSCALACVLRCIGETIPGVFSWSTKVKSVVTIAGPPNRSMNMCVAGWDVSADGINLTLETKGVHASHVLG
jgi:hypothetical protein